MDRILQTNPQEVFEPWEMNEVIGMIYNIIQRVIRDESDTLMLTPVRFVWSRGEHIIGEFPIDLVKPTVSFRDSLKMILDRDEVLQEQLQLINDESGELSYRIDSIGCD